METKRKTKTELTGQMEKFLNGNRSWGYNKKTKDEISHALNGFDNGFLEWIKNKFNIKETIYDKNDIKKKLSSILKDDNEFDKLRRGYILYLRDEAKNKKVTARETKKYHEIKEFFAPYKTGSDEINDEIISIIKEARGSNERIAKLKIIFASSFYQKKRGETTEENNNRIYRISEVIRIVLDPSWNEEEIGLVLNIENVQISTFDIANKIKRRDKSENKLLDQFFTLAKIRNSEDLEKYSNVMSYEGLGEMLTFLERCQIDENEIASCLATCLKYSFYVQEFLSKLPSIHYENNGGYTSELVNRYGEDWFNESNTDKDLQFANVEDRKILSDLWRSIRTKNRKKNLIVAEKEGILSTSQINKKIFYSYDTNNELIAQLKQIPHEQFIKNIAFINKIMTEESKKNIINEAKRMGLPSRSDRLKILEEYLGITDPNKIILLIKRKEFYDIGNLDNIKAKLQIITRAGITLTEKILEGFKMFSRRNADSYLEKNINILLNGRAVLGENEILELFTTLENAQSDNLITFLSYIDPKDTTKINAISDALQNCNPRHFQKILELGILDSNTIKKLTLILKSQENDSQEKIIQFLTIIKGTPDIDINKLLIFITGDTNYLERGARNIGLLLENISKDPGNIQKLLALSKERNIDNLKNHLKNNNTHILIKVLILLQLIEKSEIRIDELSVFSDFLEETNKKLIKDVFGSNFNTESRLVDILALDDPIINETLTNDNKMGTIKDAVIQNIINYLKKLIEEGKTINEIRESLHKKLTEIIETFNSSQFSIVDKRALFLDNYGIEDLLPHFRKRSVLGNIEGKDKDIVEELQNHLENLIKDNPEKAEEYAYLKRKIEDFAESILHGEDKNSALKKIVKEELEDIFVKSGSKEMKAFYTQKINANGNNEIETMILKNKLSQMEITQQMADQRNRELFHKLITFDKNTKEFIDTLLPETSISQVGPATKGNVDVTLSILDLGTLCDAVLGSSAIKQEINLGSHVSTSKYGNSFKNAKSIADRLPGLGNPHGIEIEKIFGNALNCENKPYGAGLQMGSSHQLVFVGIPSTEITAIVVRSSDPNIIARQKKAIATKGFFIPLLDIQGNILMSEEEFDEMKIFYYNLGNKGYLIDSRENPYSIIDDVYKTYKKYEQTNDNKPNEQEQKKRIVLHSMFEHVKVNPEKDKDMVIVVDYIKNTELNHYGLERYEQNKNNFAVLFECIIADMRKKREQIVNSCGIEQNKEEQLFSLAPDIETKIHDFEEQLEMCGIHKGTEKHKEYENMIYDILFNENIGTKETIEYQNKISKIKKQILKDHRTASSRKIADFPKYKNKICPAFVGSLGNKECGFAGDNDFIVLIDDEIMSDVERNECISIIKQIVLDITNNWKGKGEIDAGKFQAGGECIVCINDIKSFKIDKKDIVNFQKIEPTAMINADPFFPENIEHASLDNHALQLYMENSDASYYDAIAEWALTIKGVHGESFIDNFEKNIYQKLGSGQTLENIKIGLQRTIDFKIYHLLFKGFEKGIIPREIAGKIPSTNIGPGGKVDLLIEYGILTQKEGDIINDLSTHAFQLRSIGELIPGRLKGKRVDIDQQLLSYSQRQRLFNQLKDFKENILYK